MPFNNIDKETNIFNHFLKQIKLCGNELITDEHE